MKYFCKLFGHKFGTWTNIYHNLNYLDTCRWCSRCNEVQLLKNAPLKDRVKCNREFAGLDHDEAASIMGVSIEELRRLENS